MRQPRNGRIRSVLVVALLSLVAGCGGEPSGGSAAVQSPSPTLPSSARPDASPDVIEGMFDVGGYSLWIHCEGVGSPTVVLVSGLGGDSRAWQSVAPALADESRVCSYDRAGLGRSDSRRATEPPSAGDMADELSRLLDAAHEPGPYVLIGHSFGGMIVRLFAARHLDEVMGAVFVDASSEHQFEPSWDPAMSEWRDGTRAIDRERSAAELAAADRLGSLPLVVLTEGQRGGEFEVLWAEFQDELASLSTEALHMVARDAGHVINEDAPALVVEAAIAVIETARSGDPLAACGARFEAVGAECLASTLTDQYAAWELIRAAVLPSAGALPPGVYRAESTGAQFEALTGQAEDFDVVEFIWTISGGMWGVTISFDGGTPEVTGDVYAAIGNEVDIRLPLEYKVPRTPGVNRFEWAVDPDGTLHLQQTDDWPPDPWFTVPWIRVGDAPGD